MYLIDTNIFLKQELEEDRWEECESFLNKVNLGEISAIVSDFSIDSTVIIMENNNVNSYGIAKFLNSFFYYKSLTIYEISMADRLQACEHMKNYKLDYDDSLILQTMFSNGINRLVSFDSDFDNIKEIKRLEPKDVI